LGLGLALMQASLVLAHAALLLAAPTPNGFYPADDPPTQITLTFSEEVVPTFAAIRVLSQTGETVDKMVVWRRS
jgi:methionine-rich copper-binding protein CopC